MSDVLAILDDMAMIKTYRRDGEGTLRYREAWSDKGGVWTHEGSVGAKGRSRLRPTRSRTRPDDPTATEFLREFTEEAAAAGYLPVPEDRYGWVVLQCWTHSPDLSHPEDDRLFEAGQEALDQYLGWRGVGHLDGNDIGGSPPAGRGRNGTVVNLFCRVVDTALGVKAVRGFAREFDLGPHHVIGAREPGEDAEYVLAWSPRKQDREFHL
jgi:hypothetical protein